MVLSALFLGMAFGQAGHGPPVFEVASVKLNNSETRASGDSGNGRFSWYNMPLKIAIVRAYQVTNDRVCHGRLLGHVNLKCFQCGDRLGTKLVQGRRHNRRNGFMRLSQLQNVLLVRDTSEG
jgi:hypothetical protein